jgi:hypothetical protein
VGDGAHGRVWGCLINETAEEETVTEPSGGEGGRAEGGGRKRMGYDKSYRGKAIAARLNRDLIATGRCRSENGHGVYWRGRTCASDDQEAGSREGGRPGDETESERPTGEAGTEITAAPCPGARRVEDASRRAGFRDIARSPWGIAVPYTTYMTPAVLPRPP